MTTLCALALTAGPAYADAGGLDTSFGEGGAIRLDAVDQGRIVATAVRPDGRIVAVAREEGLVGAYENILVYRLLPDGRLDPSFDRDGVARINVAPSDSPTDVALAPDDKILISGTVWPGENNTTDAAVFRLLEDGGPGPVNGALDPSFDSDGIATIDGGAYEEEPALALRPDGKIVLAGVTVEAAPETANVVVYRLKADGGPGPVNGALDPSFDGDGAAGFDTGAAESARDVALRPDGTIVVAAAALHYTNAKQTGIAMQVRPNGGNGDLNHALDPAFDDDGVAGIEIGVALDLQAMALQSDGRIVLAGHALPAANGQRDGVVIRLRAGGGSGAVNGALDPAFGRGGVATIETPKDDGLKAVALQPDGKILAAGHRAAGAADAGVVYRLTSDGGNRSGDPVDRSFGAAGALAFPESTSFAGVHAIALQPDGGIVAGGVATAPNDLWLPIVGRLLGDPGPPAVQTPDPAPPVAQPTGDAPTPKAASFGARTRVTLRVGRRSTTGRVKVRVRNANTFTIRGRLSAKGAKARSFTVAARRTRTVTLRLPQRHCRARIRATVVDPAGHSRVVRGRAS